MAARVKNPRGYRNINNGCSSNYNNEGGGVNMTAFFTGSIYIVSGTQKSHSALAQHKLAHPRIQGFKSLAVPQKVKQSYHMTQHFHA